MPFQEVNMTNTSAIETELQKMVPMINGHRANLCNILSISQQSMGCKLAIFQKTNPHAHVVAVGW